MTREEAMQLLELMKRQQNDENSVAPLEPEKLATGYVRTVSARRQQGRGGGRDDPRDGGGQA